MVLFDAGDAIVCQAALYGVHVGLAGLEVVAQQTVVGADIQHTAKLTGYTGRRTIVQTVPAPEGGQPLRRHTVRLQVQRTDPHSSGDVDAASVWRQLYL